MSRCESTFAPERCQSTRNFCLESCREPCTARQGPDTHSTIRIHTEYFKIYKKHLPPQWILENKLIQLDFLFFKVSVTFWWRFGTRIWSIFGVFDGNYNGFLMFLSGYVLVTFSCHDVLIKQLCFPLVCMCFLTSHVKHPVTFWWRFRKNYAV